VTSGEGVVAIVLTMDAQLGLAELVHKRYSRLWPDNPFRFRIPFNGVARGPAMTYLMAQPDCEVVRTGREIRESLTALLDGIGDSSWVFWCIDDRFPIWLDRRRLAAVSAALAALPSSWEELKRLRWREPLRSKVHVVGGIPFTEQGTGREWGFWHHHFVRAGVLRRVFLDPAVADGAGIQDFVFNRLRGRGRSRRLPPTLEERLFPGAALVPQAPLARLGEPLIEGQLTRNGLAALTYDGCEVPPYGLVARDKEYVWAEP
jgi:hypothetical protein